MWQDDSRRLGPTLGWAAQMAKCAMDARVSRYDVTPVQTHVLMYLNQHGGRVPQRELTEFMRAKPSTVNGILDRMEEKGLVLRTVSDTDARRRLITLTDKGREQQARFVESFLASEEAMVRGFSAEEREMLLRLLDRIVENLKEELRT